MAILSNCFPHARSDASVFKKWDGTGMWICEALWPFINHNFRSLIAAKGIEWYLVLRVHDASSVFSRVSKALLFRRPFCTAKLAKLRRPTTLCLPRASDLLWRSKPFPRVDFLDSTKCSIVFSNTLRSSVVLRQTCRCLPSSLEIIMSIGYYRYVPVEGVDGLL